MQEAIILRGGIYHYYDRAGNAKDSYVVDPHENVSWLRLFIGHPLYTLGHFPGVDNRLLIQDAKVKDNNLVAELKGEEAQ